MVFCLSFPPVQSDFHTYFRIVFQKDKSECLFSLLQGWLRLPLPLASSANMAAEPCRSPRSVPAPLLPSAPHSTFLQRHWHFCSAILIRELIHSPLIELIVSSPHAFHMLFILQHALCLWLTSSHSLNLSGSIISLASISPDLFLPPGSVRTNL